MICAAGGRSHTVVATGSFLSSKGIVSDINVHFNVMVKESGRLYTFGANGEGQLGLGNTVDHVDPTIVQGFEQQVSMVTAGSYHSAAVTSKLLNWTD